MENFIFFAVFGAVEPAGDRVLWDRETIEAQWPSVAFDDVIVHPGAVIGADRSPTPVGSFFVNDLVEKWEGSAFGPYILSLSAFSEALETFAGGIPVIAIHGTNRPELIGGAHSNGCIRIPNDVVTFLAENVPMGTPVDIVA